MGLATTTLRIGLGGLMAGHGLQKLAGKFGGAGLDGTADGFAKMGFEPGRPYAAAAGVAETVGGTLLATGMWTPLGAAMVTGVMGTAIAKVHAKNGVWVSKGGFEYNATIIAAAFAITEAGPGFPAIDGLITKRRKGFFWAATELVAGLGAAAATIALTERGNEAGAVLSQATSRPASVISSLTQKVAGRVASTADAVADTARTASDSVIDATDQASEVVTDGAGAVSEQAGAVAEDAARNAAH